METYRITFSDGSTTEVRDVSEEKALFQALDNSHLHIVRIEEVK